MGLGGSLIKLFVVCFNLLACLTLPRHGHNTSIVVTGAVSQNLSGKSVCSVQREQNLSEFDNKSDFRWSETSSVIALC